MLCKVATNTNLNLTQPAILTPRSTILEVSTLAIIPPMQLEIEIIGYFKKCHTDSILLLLFCFYFQPENILLDDNLNIKLSDFGFATVLGPEEELTGRSCQVIS